MSMVPETVPLSLESIIRQVGIDQIPHVALTHGQQRRDFIFVDDVVQAYLKLIDFRAPRIIKISGYNCVEWTIVRFHIFA